MAVLSALCLPGAFADGAEPARVVRIGITAFRDKSVTLRQWQPTMDYLASKIRDTRFVAVPMTPADFERAMVRGELDFVITNPEQYIRMADEFGVSRVATLVEEENGRLVSRFGGVIFTRSDRKDINGLEDVRGKRIAAVDRTSFAAYLLQYDTLHRDGIDIDKESRVHFLGFPQDLCVKAVLTGKADVGFVRTGVLEAMAQEGSIELSGLKVLGAQTFDDFPFLDSTPLFPEWPIAATRNAPVDITNRVVAALLLMPPGSAAARSARYYRWASPQDYTGVENLMRVYHVPPFDRPERITPRQMFQQYGMYLSAAVLIFSLVVVILYLRSRRLNAELHRTQAMLRELAYHDALTGLPNRPLLDDRLALAIAQARRAGRRLAVCLIDLDGFKPINDRLGHRVGDEVLQGVASRLRAMLREGDTVARWGGDEFVLVLAGLADDAQLEEIMQRLLTALAAPFDCCHGAPIGASIGVALYPVHGLADDDLLRHADEAMYRAKKAGGNRFVVYGQA